MNILTHKKALVIGGIVALVILVLLSLAVVFRSNVSMWWSFATAPQGVQNSLFLTGKDHDHTILSQPLFGFIATTWYGDKTFVEVVKVGNTTTAILKNVLTEKVDVYTIKNGKAVALTTDGRPKQNLTVSADNVYVAFTYVAPPSVTQTTLLKTLDLSKYEVTVIERATGIKTSYGFGVYTHFIEGQRLFFASNKGLVIKNLSNGEESVFADSKMVSHMTNTPIFISADSFVLRNDLLPQYDEFKITPVDTILSISAVRTIPSFDRDVYALTSNEKNVLYGVHTNKEKNTIELLESENGVTKTIFTFPSTFVPQDITYIQK